MFIEFSYRLDEIPVERHVVKSPLSKAVAQIGGRRQAPGRRCRLYWRSTGGTENAELDDEG